MPSVLFCIGSVPVQTVPLCIGLDRLLIFTSGVCSGRSMTFTCNSARYVLEYKTYLVYRPGDLRANYALFRDALSDMLTPDRIRKNSRTVRARCRRLYDILC